jgi:hypothetical protein
VYTFDKIYVVPAPLPTDAYISKFQFPDCIEETPGSPTTVKKLCNNVGELGIVLTSLYITFVRFPLGNGGPFTLIFLLNSLGCPE